MKWRAFDRKGTYRDGVAKTHKKKAIIAIFLMNFGVMRIRTGRDLQHDAGSRETRVRRYAHIPLRFLCEEHGAEKRGRIIRP